jgi:hypothetical protein
MLIDADLPPLYHAANKSSTKAQSWFLWATRVRLFGVLGAAFFGLFTWKFGMSPVDWAGVLAASCFAVALVVEAYLSQWRGPPKARRIGRPSAGRVSAVA